MCNPPEERVEDAAITHVHQPQVRVKSPYLICGLALSLAANLVLYWMMPPNDEVDADGKPLWSSVWHYNISWPYELQGFDTSGMHVWSDFDTDNNGRSERSAYFRDGRMIQEVHDRDQNGKLERMRMLHDGQPTFEMVDADEDGYFEIGGIPNTGGPTHPLYYDENKDGRFDRVECKRGSTIRSLQIDTCQVE